MFKREGFRKNLLRVKQLADQNLGRAEKTEIPEELLSLEKRVDHIKLVCKNTHQKLSACMTGQGPDVEKRLKKMPDALLAYSMSESATMLGRDSLMGQMFMLCGGAVSSIAQEHMNYEITLEQQVLKDINNILENDIPLIHKQKKQLNKVTLDYDSARARYHASQKQNNVAGKGELKEEKDEAHQRVIQCKDQFSTDMMQFVAKEADYSRILLDLVNAQKEYHTRALDVLMRVIPQMQETADFTPHMPVYKQSLEDHLQRTNRDIAVVIEECVITLLNFTEEEGLFRITGGASKVKKLRAAFDSGLGIDMDDALSDIHSVAGALKLYLRELPEPLMTFNLYDDWVQAAHQPPDQRLQALWLVLDKMPKPNYNNLRYLIKFLSKLVEYQDVNKMSASNIAIVMGPNLIWPPGEGGPSVMMSGTQSGIVEALVSHADWFFPGEIEEFNNPAGSTSGDSPVFSHVNDHFGVSSYDAQPAQPSIPVNAAPPSECSVATALLSAADAGPMAHSMTSSTGSLSLSPEGNGGAPSSPKLGRRTTRKPPAPLPPGGGYHERKSSSGGTFDFSSGGTLERGTRSHEGTLERPTRTSGPTLEHRLSGGHIERPSVPPPQPPQSPGNTLPRKSSHKRSASSDLVSVTVSPPEEQVIVNEVARSISYDPRPAIPSRPDEMPTQDRPVVERPPIPDRPATHPSSQQVTINVSESANVSEKPSSPQPDKPRQPRPDRPHLPPPDRPPLKEKPELPPPPASFSRQGSGRPPRPTPPVAPDRRHHEPKAPLAQEEPTESKPEEVSQETHL